MATQSISHIPAWKKIGLELKRPAQTTAEADLAKKRRRVNETSPPALPSGPGAIVPVRESQTHGKANGSSRENDTTRAGKSATVAINLRNATQQPEKAAEKRRSKSVSFSAETKLEDGDGVRDLSNEPDDKEALERANAGHAKKKRKTKNPSPTKSSSPSTKQKHSDVVSLDYLISYSNDRDSWKFNKTHQTWLLKNLFNLQRIPAVHDERLVSYFTGLQGQNARSRLKSDAQAILTKGEHDSAETEIRSEATHETPKSSSGDAAEGDNLGQDVKGQAYDLKTRARKILDVLAVRSRLELISDQGEMQTKPLSQNRRGTKSRGRKRRTGPAASGEVEDSSDSSSSEESDSSAEQEFDEVSNGAQKARNAVQRSFSSSDETSSSDSSEVSSSSEESD